MKDVLKSAKEQYRAITWPVEQKGIEDYLLFDKLKREKMAEEFYNNYKRDIEMYQKSIQKFIDSGVTENGILT